MINLLRVAESYYISVEWGLLERLSNVEDKLKHLHLTTKLHLYVKHHNEGNENENNRAKAFNNIISSCDKENLRQLDIHRYMVPKSVQKISERVPELQELNISFIYTKYISDYSYICELTQLTTLHIYDCNIQDVNTANFDQLVHLQELAIEFCLGLTKECLTYLTTLSSLRKFLLCDCWNIVDDTQCTMGGLTDIRAISLTGIQVHDVFFEGVCNTVKDISELITTSRYLTDVGFSHISMLKTLVTLDITSSKQLTDRGLAYLSRLVLLRKLALGNCKLITDTGLRHLSKLKLLSTLDISECNKVTDTGIHAITRDSVLGWLNLYGCELLTNVAMEYVSELRFLKMLDISSCHLITDTGLSHLTKLDLSLLSMYDLRCVSTSFMKGMRNNIKIVRF